MFSSRITHLLDEGLILTTKAKKIKEILRIFIFIYLRYRLRLILWGLESYITIFLLWAYIFVNSLVEYFSFLFHYLPNNERHYLLKIEVKFYAGNLYLIIHSRPIRAFLLQFYYLTFYFWVDSNDIELSFTSFIAFNSFIYLFGIATNQEALRFMLLFSSSATFFYFSIAN